MIVLPIKGTTWAMNIVHQLRTKGDRNFEDVYAEVRWIEVMDTPSSTVDEMVKKIDSMDTTKPRTFKTHAAPPTLPFHDKIKYLVIARNPEECVVSMRHFISKRSPEFNKYWNVSPMNFPNVESLYNAFGKDLMKRSFAFVSEWWKLRNKENVLMLHYSDMVKDHEHSIKKISDFLDFGPYTDEEWQTILELTSFSWMKQHERKFEGRTIWAVPILVRGGMIRQGSSGLARKEGISEELANDLRMQGKEVLKDDTAFEWFYNGGELC